MRKYSVIPVEFAQNNIFCEQTYFKHVAMAKDVAEAIILFFANSSDIADYSLKIMVLGWTHPFIFQFSSTTKNHKKQPGPTF